MYTKQATILTLSHEKQYLRFSHIEFLRNLLTPIFDSSSSDGGAFKNLDHQNLSQTVRAEFTKWRIYGTIRDHIQEFYKGEMKKSLNLL